MEPSHPFVFVSLLDVRLRNDNCYGTIRYLVEFIASLHPRLTITLWKVWGFFTVPILLLLFSCGTDLLSHFSHSSSQTLHWIITFSNAIAVKYRCLFVSTHHILSSSPPSTKSQPMWSPHELQPRIRHEKPGNQVSSFDNLDRKTQSHMPWIVNTQNAFPKRFVKTALQQFPPRRFNRSQFANKQISCPHLQRIWVSLWHISFSNRMREVPVSHSNNNRSSSYPMSSCL